MTDTLQPTGSRPTGSRLGYTTHLAIVLTTVVGINIGYTAVLPYLPEFAATLKLSPTMIMVFFAGFAVAKILGQPLGGVLVDRRGLRVTAVAGLALSAVGMAMVAMADTANTAIIGRLVWGFADGIVTPSLYGAIAAVSARYNRDAARGYAKLGTAAVLSFAGGPLVVGLVHSFADYQTVLSVAVVLTLLNVVAAGLLMPARAPRESVDESQEKGPRRLGPMLAVVVVFGGFDLFSHLLWGAMEPLVPLYVEQTYEDPVGYSAWVLTVGMLAFAAANPLLARLPDRWRSPRLAGPGMVVLALATVALSKVAVLSVGLIAMVVFMVAQSYIYLIAREGIRLYSGGSGVAWGAFGMLSDAGLVLGPVIGVYLFNTAGASAFTILGIGSAIAAVAVTVGMRRWQPATVSEPRKAHDG